MTNELLKRIAILEYEVERLEKNIQVAVDFIKKEEVIEYIDTEDINKYFDNYEQTLLKILEGGSDL